jgi:starch synthase
MKILVAASELTPFSKTGGLGDVVGALPKALAALGHEVITFSPRYGSIDENTFPLEALEWRIDVPVDQRKQPLTAAVFKDKKSGIDNYFINNEAYFDRRELYLDAKTGTDYADNDERFIFFSRGVLEAARKTGFKPDIIHVHDWQAGLIPVYLKTHYDHDSFFGGVKTVLTIHNLAYQGQFDQELFRKLNIPKELIYATGPFEFYGKMNFLKAAIAYADKITTVSPSYAVEIQSSPELGCGLEDVLKNRSADLVGILNGVDYSLWSPSRDQHLPYSYHVNNLSGKRMNKVELLGEAKLPIRDKTPLIGLISRLVDQKGFDLIAEAADRLFDMNIQMILLGTGEERYHQLFTRMQKKYPDKLRVYLTFDETLAHRIEAGADVFLMPSRFEPCGLNQMYSLKYGTVPIVREVGGLADTVVNYNPDTGAGTGFVFKNYTSEELLTAVRRAVDLFAKRRSWTKLMKAGMRQDFSWQKSARKYSQLFEQLVHS